MQVLLCFQLMQNVCFNWNMYNFKFNFLLQGQLDSSILTRYIQNIQNTTMLYKAFSVT